MTATRIPPRFPRATPTEEAARLEAIRTGRDWRPAGDVERVRHTGGAMGWRRGGEIYADAEPELTLLAYYRTNSTADQEDLGVPAAGWYTGYGYWLPADDNGAEA